MSLQVIEKENHLAGLTERLHERVPQANLELGERMGETARELVAVDTGELQDSIEVEERDDRTVAVTAGTDHAEPNEFGTVHMAAHPFMLPAFDQHVGEADELFGRAVREAAGGS